MTPKEKAKKLVEEFYNEIKYMERAKQCALIAVDEIIRANPHSNPFNTDIYSTMNFWQEVKQEILKL